MKATPSGFADAARKMGGDLRLCLFLGPDEAGSADLANGYFASLGKNVERVDIAGSELKLHPARLADEAASLSLFGDKICIWVTTQGEESLAAIELLLGAPSVANPAIMIVSGITEKANIAKLVGAAKNALLCNSAFPGAAQMADMIVKMAAVEGLELTAELATRIAEDTGLNRRLAQAEVEKLALYLDAGPDNPVVVAPEIVTMLGAPTEDDNMVPVINCILSGKLPELESELHRLADYGISDVGLLLGLQRRTMLLVENPPYASRSDAAFPEQARIWRKQALARLNERLLHLHSRMMMNSQSGATFLHQELLEIAQVAATMAGRR